MMTVQRLLVPLALTAMLLPAFAHAAGLPPPWHPTPCQDPAMASFGVLLDGAGKTIAGNLVGYGAIMLRGFLIVALAWYGALMMFSVGTALAEPQQLVMKVIAWGFIFTVFNYYGLIYQDVSQAFQELAGAVMGSDSSTHQAACTMFEIADHLTAVAQNMPLNNKDGGMLSLFTSPGSTVGAFFEWFWMVLIITVSAIALSFGALIYALWQLAFTMLLALAFTMGPIAIPMMMYRFTRELFFDSWLGFLWTALMYQFVGPLILTIVAVIVEKGLVPSASGTSFVNYSASGFLTLNVSALFVLNLIVAGVLWMLWKLPAIVGQLASGAAHAGLGGGLGNIASQFTSKGSAPTP